MNSAEFEQRLKQLRPVSCDDRTAETFYQSGWQACEQSLALQRAKTVSSVHKRSAFATGLVCGLLMWATVAIWSSSMESEPVIVDAKPSVQSAPESAPELVRDAAITEKDVPEQEFNATQKIASQHWMVDDIFVASRLMMDTPSPLSLASRRGWSAQIKTFSAINGSGSQDDRSFDSDIDQDPLTIAPMNNRLLQELML